MQSFIGRVLSDKKPDSSRSPWGIFIYMTDVIILADGNQACVKMMNYLRKRWRY